MAHSVVWVYPQKMALCGLSQGQRLAILQYSTPSSHGTPGTHLPWFVPHPEVLTIAVPPHAHGLRISERRPNFHSTSY